MAEVKWIKILVDIFDDEAIELIEQMPDGDSLLIIWFKLLAKAGKCNDGGLIYFKENIPYTEEMLATIFKKPIATIRLAIQTFIQFGLIELTDTHQILIRNWEKHQNVEAMEQIREYNRIAKRKSRKKKKELEELKRIECQKMSMTQNGNVIECHETDIEEEKEEEKELITTTTSSACEKNSDISFYGEYLNVALTKSQYGKLLTFVMHEKKLKELIEQFGKNIEIGKEKRFSENLPNAHFERLLAYWKYIKTHPQNFKNENIEITNDDDEILSLDEAFKAMGGK